MVNKSSSSLYICASSSPAIIVQKDADWTVYEVDEACLDSVGQIIVQQLNGSMDMGLISKMVKQLLRFAIGDHDRDLRLRWNSLANSIPNHSTFLDRPTSCHILNNLINVTVNRSTLLNRPPTSCHLINLKQNLFYHRAYLSKL
ncbi:hypothetical protein Salat_2381400 [Sesamum alatum]|uniref:Uncharacterized protein n=1 Tax=Sesamum alatum TaxID=300844 RepID=A0AAE1XX69_9LAMI|nr:hypothetical protein Salat_2381400 [Sesamum alatum]